MSGDQQRVEELADVLERAVGELHRLTICGAGRRPAHPPPHLAVVRRLWLVYERLGDAVAEVNRFRDVDVERLRTLVGARLAEDDLVDDAARTDV